MGYNRRDMATNFPTSLDNLTNPAGSDPVNNPSHASQHANLNDAIEVLETKVGINNSADTTSLDYRVKSLETTPTYTNEMAQDAVAAALAAGTHTNITINYNDTGNSISISAAAGYTNEEAVDAVAAALTAGSGISISYNDPANTITISVDSTIATKTYVDTAVSNLGSTAASTYVPVSEVGQADGIATLDANARIPLSQLGNLVDGAPLALDTLNELAAAINDDASYAATITTALGLKAATADIAELAQDAVGNNLGAGLSYNDTTGTIGVNPGAMLNQIVDGTSGNSYGLVGTSAYLDVKDNNGYNKEIELDITAVETQLVTDGFAKSASPTLTGTPLAPTASSGTNTTQIATTAFVKTAIDSSVQPGAVYQTSAPSSPAVGQIWIDSDENVTTFDSNIIRRKAITATAGQTVFTADLPFIDGFEQIFMNGLLLVKTTDYATSGGNTVTLTSAAAASDVIEIVSVTGANSVSTYTQAETDALLAANTSVAPLSISANTTLVAKKRYFVTSASALTLTLPASPALNDEIQIVDASGNASTYNITVARNANKINGGTGNLIIDNNGGWYTLLYTGATYGWKVG